MKQHIVPSGVRVMPLFSYLRRAYPMCAERKIRAAIKARDVKVNGARGAETVRGGDEICLYLPDADLTGALIVLGRNGGVIALEKPPGLPVDADADGVGEDTVQRRLDEQYPGARIAHRLDAGTGGVLIAAEGADYEKALAAFRGREVQKTYECVVKGCPAPASGALRDRLITRGGKTYVAPEGQLALLTFRALRRGEAVTLLEIDLHTGRTHQIRAQMAHIGCPLVGDDLYGDRAFNRRYARRDPALWCVKIEILGRVYESAPRLSDCAP